MKNTTTIQKNLEIDSDTGIGYKIVSFDMPENTSLPQKTYQLYALYGKKIQKKNQIKTETISPLDDLFKRQYNKNARKLRLELLSNSNMMNDIPKKISPIFGRTAYAFYTKKEIEGFRGSVNNSLRMKGNNIINITNNNAPLSIKFISNGKK
jgi:alpha-galactosidase